MYVTFYSCSSCTWMSLYTFTHKNSHMWVVSGPVDFIPSLAACAQFHPPLPSLPAAVAAQLPAAAREAQRLPLFCEHPASLLWVPSSDCQWDTQPDLSTCTDVDELRHCVDFFSLSLSQFCILCCVCVHFKKHLKDYFLCSFFLLIHAVFKDLLGRVQLKLFIILRSNKSQCNISL